MGDMISFDFEGNAVRVIDRAGEPWFVANDVCRCLEIGNSSDAISRLDADEKGVVNTDTLGGLQKVAVVSEPGVYRLVFTRRKAAAERFKRWLAHDVLPSIRRSGRYEMPDHHADMPLVALAAATVPAGVVSASLIDPGYASEKLRHCVAATFATARSFVYCRPAPGEADEAADLADQWLALGAQLGRGLSDDETDRIGDLQSEVYSQLVSTPASTIAGLCAKLEVLVEWTGLPASLHVGEAQYYNDKMLLSLLADAKALEQVGH